MKSFTRKRQLQQSLLQFFLTTTLLALFLSSPLWLSFMFSSLNLLSTPKCLFVASNAIVAALFIMSKFSDQSSNASTDIYEEYSSRNKCLRRPRGAGERDHVEPFVEESTDEGLEELNRRVEDYIARVNKQRRMEAIRDEIYLWKNY